MALTKSNTTTDTGRIGNGTESATVRHKCAKHGYRHSTRLSPGTPEQKFVGVSYGCALCPAGGSTLVPSRGLIAQLARARGSAVQS